MNNIDLTDFDEDFKYANSPKKNVSGFVKGQVIKIEKKNFIDKKERTSKSLQDDRSYIGVEFTFLLEGIIEPIKTTLRTGTNLNPDKIHVKAKGRGAKTEKPEYNAFTEICLRLGLIDIQKLENRDVEMLANLTSKFKEISQEKPIYIKTQLTLPEELQIEIVNIRSIELIETFTFEKN